MSDEIKQIKNAYNKEDYKTSLSLASNILKELPNNFEALSYKGACELKLGEYNNAIKTFSKCLYVNDRGFHIWTFRGDAHYELGEYNKAFSDYWYSLQIEPDNGAVMDKCARSLFRLGDKEYAIKYITRAVEKSESVEPFVIMATMLINMGYKKEAHNILTSAVTMFPDEEERIKKLFLG